MFKHYGIKLIKSSGLNNLLTTEMVDYLCELHENKEHVWPNGVVTVTSVHQTQDEYGRNGIWNHTIAMKLLDYLAYMQPSKLLQPYFIEKLDKPPTWLEPLTVNGNE